MSQNPNYNLEKVIGQVESKQEEQIFEKKEVSFIGKVAAAGTALFSAVASQAALVAPTFDSADAITVGTAVLGGLALIWGIKKAMSMAK